jgi:DNA-directed RNA polymerase specialized sigma24 family protein
MNLLELFPWESKNQGCENSCTDDLLEHPIVFVERFWQWRDSLYVVAYRVLNDARAATDAVEACFRKACQNPPKFASDGAFGSWLLRILLKEALQVRRRRKFAPKGFCHHAVTTAADQAAALAQGIDDLWCLETML